MARSTRSKPASSKKKEEPTTATTKKLDPSVSSPPHLLVLPKTVSPAARIITVPHPASSAPTRYFVCPDQGFYEFTQIAAPSQQRRSWLLASDKPRDGLRDNDGLPTSEKDNNQDKGYVLQAPDVLVATPLDPLFLLIPSLVVNLAGSGQEFLAPSDFSARLGESSAHLAYMLQVESPGRLAQMLEHRISAVCDCMDMGDDKVYALSLPKLTTELVSKAKKLSARRLPDSMEDRFVQKALDVPVLNLKKEEGSISIATDDEPVVSESEASAAQSQESIASVMSVTSRTTVSTAATSISSTSDCKQQSEPEGVQQLLRIRVALDYILTSYLSPAVKSRLQPFISDANASGIDFGPLDEHIQNISRMTKEAQALRSLSDNISRKRNFEEDDDEALEKAEAKKRKKEEEEHRKKNVSQGVKKLMKADTSGMKKLSSFFSKPTPKK